MHPVTASLCILATALLGACAPAPRVPGPAASVASVQVVCTASLDVACFEAPSRLCGKAGYDLFDLEGRPATVGDARYRTLEARCRR